MSIKTEAFTITANTSGDDVKATGIQSVANQKPKTLLRIWIRVKSYQGAIVRCYHGQDTPQEAYDYMFAGWTAIASGTDFNGDLKQGFEVNKVLPVGDPYQPAVSATGTANVIYGVYEYEQDD